MDFAAEYDKHFIKGAFDSNVTFNPPSQESSADSDSEPDGVCLYDCGMWVGHIRGACDMLCKLLDTSGG